MPGPPLLHRSGASTRRHRAGVRVMPFLFLSKIVPLNHQPVRPRHLAHLLCSLRPRSCCSPRDSPAAMLARACSAMQPLLAPLSLVLPSSPCAQSRQANSDMLIEDAAHRQPLQEARRLHHQADFEMARGHGGTAGVARQQNIHTIHTIVNVTAAAVAARCCRRPLRNAHAAPCTRWVSCPRLPSYYLVAA